MSKDNKIDRKNQKETMRVRYQTSLTTVVSNNYNGTPEHDGIVVIWMHCNVSVEKVMEFFSTYSFAIVPSSHVDRILVTSRVNVLNTTLDNQWQY